MRWELVRACGKGFLVSQTLLIFMFMSAPIGTARVLSDKPQHIFLILHAGYATSTLTNVPRRFDTATYRAAVGDARRL